jgi:hypothetical protein
MLRQHQRDERQHKGQQQMSREPRPGTKMSGAHHYLSGRCYH